MNIGERPEDQPIIIEPIPESTPAPEPAPPPTVPAAPEREPVAP